ncbi:MAG: aminotransferase class IV [Ignavibacteria bacterium]
MKQIIDPYTNSAYKFGFGFYETMRAIDKNIIFFTEHMLRLNSTLSVFDLQPLDPPEVYEKIMMQLNKKSLNDARIRITYSLQGEPPKPVVTYEILPFKPTFKDKAKIMIDFDHILLHGDEIRKYKTTNAFHYIYAFNKARTQNFDEVIFLDNEDHILEGSRTNIFLIFDDDDKKSFTIKTPATECGVLPGIAKKILIDFLKEKDIQVIETTVHKDELEKADEVFLTNSLHGIIPVKSISNLKTFSTVKTKKLKQNFEKRYFTF